MSQPVSAFFTPRTLAGATRCIALAGVNRALQPTNAIAEDGLLTGLEASLPNLQGRELGQVSKELEIRARIN